MRKTRLLPPILTLTSGAITILILYFRHTQLQKLLLILLLVMLLFAIVGTLIRNLLEKVLVIPEKAVSDEGEVVEKPVEEEPEEETEQAVQK